MIIQGKEEKTVRGREPVKLDKFIVEDSDYEGAADGQADDSDDSDSNQVRRNKNKKKHSAKDKQPKDNMNWQTAFDEEGDDVEIVDGKKKKNIKKAALKAEGGQADFGGKRKRLTKKPKESKNPNMVKTNNKLLGEIENKDLYDSDEGLCDRHLQDNQEDLRGQNIELDLGEVKREKKELGQLFQKINNKKQQRVDPHSIESTVMNLGFVQNIWEKISANELAAKGI